MEADQFAHYLYASILRREPDAGARDKVDRILIGARLRGGGCCARGRCARTAIGASSAEA